MSVSKKHYEAIAKAINAIVWVGPLSSKEALCNLAAMLGGVFAADNPAYDHARFLEACFGTLPSSEPVAGVLFLTHSEAQTLRDVCALIGGDPSKTRRVHMDRISEALDKAGFHYMHHEDGDYCGGIDFTEVT